MSAHHSSVADSVLGLTSSELTLLRQQQEILAQRSHQSGMHPDRGRGTSKQSQPSSRAVSAASSHSVPGRIILDPHSLDALDIHLNNMMRAMQRRMGELEDSMQESVQVSSNRAATSVQQADNQIARLRRNIAELEKLDDECNKVKRIRDRIKRLRANVDGLGDRVDRSRPSGHGPSGVRPRR